MFEKPIVIYSNYCTYSQAFMQSLSNVPDLFDVFVRLCIDVDINTNKRPDIFYIIQEELQTKITKVPTIILNGGKVILSGSEAFSWLKSVVSEESSKQNEPDAFAPNEMMGLSDSYSKFGSSDMTDASEKSFVFLNKKLDSIPTPEDDHVKITQQDYQRLQSERDTPFNQEQQHPSQPNSFPVRQQRQQMMSQPLNNRETFTNKMQRKDKDLDQKLEQLIMERNNISPPQNLLHPSGQQQYSKNF